jgi:hypothetical protein
MTQFVDLGDSEEDYVMDQPPEETLRSARLWNAWVAARLSGPKEA